MSGSKMYDFSKFARDAGSYSSEPNRSVPDISNRQNKAALQGRLAQLRKKLKTHESLGNKLDANEVRAEIERLSRDMATDPPESQAQRGAMFAAKAGKSNLGIPQKVGEEFAKADLGGKLPARKR